MLKKFLILASVGAAAAIGWWIGSKPDGSSLTFLDVGQGDAVLLSSRGSHMLVDAGPRFSTNRLLMQLRLRGVDQVDVLVLTHPDADHAGGVSAVLRRYPRARLLISQRFRDHPQVVRWLSDWRVGEDQIEWIGSEARVRLGECLVEWQDSGAPKTAEDNQGSPFLRLDCQGSTAVLQGDAGISEEARMARRVDWSAQVLMAGHHGSADATGVRWLEEIEPEVVVISSGAGNRYGHPSPALLQRLERRNIPILRTDRMGDIQFRAESGRWILIQSK